MNVIELLILLAFIFFPLIQIVLEKLGGNRGEQLPPDYDPESYQTTTEMEAGGVLQAEAEPVEGGWSSGWSEWPTEELPDELQIEGPVSDREAERFLRMRESLDTPDTPALPEAVRVQVPVVSLESLTVDRAAEHRRLHARVRAATPPSARPPQNPLGVALRSRSGVRQAVLLAEVLGPPRALNPLEHSDKI